MDACSDYEVPHEESIHALTAQNFFLSSVMHDLLPSRACGAIQLHAFVHIHCVTRRKQQRSNERQYNACGNRKKQCRPDEINQTPM